MVLRLDPRIPLVWRDPASLQFGVTEPLVVIRDLAPVDELMLGALSRGAARSALDVIACDAGGESADVDRLLATIAPVLDTATDAPAPRVAVSGSGATAAAIAAQLADLGVAVFTGEDEPLARRSPDLAVVVAAWAVEPARYGPWLRRDIPHLPVVIGDRHVELGPVVEAGVGPCGYCLARARMDADPAWPAIAAQLQTRAAPEPALVVAEVSALAGRRVLARLRDGAASEHRTVRIAVADGTLEERVEHRHPDCACADEPRLSRGRRGSGSAAAMLPTRRTVRPTTSAGSSAPA
ncbi:hypothetical protein QT381_10900 [Galbitalea sp. SE-J8]|uniref:hypothetical protein n=1 Tax=Galbitalea sp. SE-J8 TaxID=3054952 RepID=UPI00259D115A|nr:hypothetical protein [Galbitalea sp. SE-J8]MDM4763518.1 hypothetical protein [Galbitalea sp. SE-J8]